MKNLLKGFIFIVLAVSCCFIVFAQTDDAIYRFEYEDAGKTVIFSDDTSISEAKRQQIADSLVYGTEDEDGATVLSWCWLIGHNYTVDIVIVITHKVNPTTPRCLRETFEVTTCTRCDYYNIELISSTYIFCCS